LVEVDEEVVVTGVLVGDGEVSAPRYFCMYFKGLTVTLRAFSFPKPASIADVKSKPASVAS
jgi:hypothetical protein